MNLTYEVENNSYTIINNGLPWIVQENFFPYKKDTVEGSAQAHIDAILAEQQMQVNQLTAIEELQQSQADQDSLVMSIVLGEV